MPEAGQALHLVDEDPGEQALRRQLAVPVDVVEHQLVIGGGAVAPVQDLLAGELLEDQLLVDVDVGELRLRSGDRPPTSSVASGLRWGHPAAGGAPPPSLAISMAGSAAGPTTG